MQVDIWSDIVCPWCYIGKRRFEAALARFPHRDAVTVIWRAFELDPSTPTHHDEAYRTRLARKYGVTPEAAEEMIARMTSVAAAEGLEYRFDHAHVGNTRDAHRLLHLAGARGKQGELAERLFRACFVEGEPIGLSQTLLRLGIEVGLDADEVWQVLDSEAYGDAVRAEESAAADLGIRGVPFFVIDHRLAVSGAQSSEVLAEALDQAWAERAPLPGTPTGAARATGADPGREGESCAV